MDQLYQDRILAFARSVRDTAELDDATHVASVSNPTCGDRVNIRLKLEAGTIVAASTAVRGCALCEAGAGFLLEMAPGLTTEEFTGMGDTLRNWLGGEDGIDIPHHMSAFAPVREIRNRHKCVTLAFDAGAAALSSDSGD